MEKIINNKKVKILSTAVILLTVFFVMIFSKNVLATNEENDSTISTYEETSTEEQMVYLSDIQYQTGKTAYGSILMDKTASNTPITMYLDGNLVSFKKGIWAHATSTIIYNLTDYDYDYFFTYYGVCTSSGNQGNGVKFEISTSEDGVNWTVNTPEEVLLSGSGARQVTIDIRNVNYLKLYAYDNGTNGNDHAVYADAKLYKEGYSDNVTKTVEEYDELIKAKYANGTIDDELELLLLQREFVNNAGQYQLKAFFENGEEDGKSEETEEVFNWLFNDLDILRLYIAGGTPDGTYVQSLEVLRDLYIKYKADLSATGTTENGVQLSTIYTKMILSLSLTHSQTVSFWVYSTPPAGESAPDPNPNVSVASNRYEIYKYMLENGKLETNIFETLEIEEMRYIMASFINDDEIEWLSDYANTKTIKYSAYSYMNYLNVNTALYRSEKYYADDISEYEEKYNLSGYNVINTKYYPRLWMIMDVGGVCWQLSNVGQCVASSLGVPSTIVGQPGHVAYLVYGLDENGNGIWSMWNDVFGWANTTAAGYTGTKGYYAIRFLNNWGSGSYASNNKGSYMLLGQAAINDYDNYVKAKENVILADAYEGDNEKVEEIYRNALKEQSINFDAWLGLVNLYANDETKTEEDLYNLAVEVTDNLKYYPLPMVDLLKILNNKITSTAYGVQFTLLQNKALNEASVVTNNDVLQSDVVRTMAKYLLGTLDTEVAKFSFDGDEAGILSLSSKYETTQAYWDYSLDNGKTWIEVTDGSSVKLTDEQIESITVDNDIKVHIIGVGYEEENIYTIDISKATTPTALYNNDLENKVIGANDTMEWRLSESDNWTSYKESEPDLTGDKQVQVRIGATGTYLPSDFVTYNFTQDIDTETRKYIPISHLSVYSVSSEQTSQSQTGQKAIDGNIKTIWHTAWDGSDKDRYIVIKLDEPFYISSLEYVPRQDATNGRLKSGKMLVSLDGENWTEVATISDWANNASTKTINLEESVKAHYVKLVATENYGSGSYLSAAMINLFEDTTKDVGPIAEVSYSTTLPTSENVVATISFSEEVNILNDIELTKQEDGTYTYTFTENDSFTLEFEDMDNNKGEVDLEVNCIDKETPTAEVTYNITELTNQDVVATIKFSEEVNILNENLNLQLQDDGSYIYVFMSNSGFCLEFEDIAGNKGQAEVSVSWIDKTAPKAVISYSTTETTSESVTATITFNKTVNILNENVEITKQEDGSYQYVFNENGEVTFEFVDEAGNVGYVTAKVDWIENEEENKNDEDNNNGEEENKNDEDDNGEEENKDNENDNKEEKFFTSEVHEIEDGYISKIEERTTFASFRKNINTSQNVKLTDRNGNELSDDTILKTGLIVKVDDDVQYEIVVNGDTDGDGVETINDLARLKLHLIENTMLEGAYFKAADLDEDSNVTINDLAKMKLTLIEK